MLCLFSFLFNFLVLQLFLPFGPCAIPPPTKIGAFLLACLAGGARHASKKAPIFVGGGIAHGPKGRNSYKTRKLNKNEKRQSISSILSKKLKLKEVIVFDDFSKEIKKTKEMDKILKKFDAQNSILILDKNSKDKIFRATKNIPNVKCTDIGHFSAYDILKFKKIIFTESSVKELEKRYN